MVIRAWALIHKFMSKKLKLFCQIMCTPWETGCQTAMRYVRIIIVRILLWLNADEFRLTFADNRVVKPVGGRGVVLPYMGNIGMCGPKGFWEVGRIV